MHVKKMMSLLMLLTACDEAFEMDRSAEDLATFDSAAQSSAEELPSPTLTPPLPCSYRIYRDNIRAARGEGGADPALELTRVEASAGGSTVTWSGRLPQGSSHTADALILSESVSSGTVISEEWEVFVVEKDDWDADDINQGGGILSFTCSGHGTRTGTVALTLGNAQVDVTVKAVW